MPLNHTSHAFKRLICILLLLALTASFFSGCKKKQPAESTSASGTESISVGSDSNDLLDPENTDFGNESGAPVKAAELEHKTGKANGIDVSKWQGKIDWSAVKAAGIDFAVIRIGYRGENGIIYKDSSADYNLQQADKAGLLTGVYFFGTAKNTAEAEEEAKWTAAAIEGYAISYPVVYDCEGFLSPESRMYNLTSRQRTDNALAFLKQIQAKGYEGMFYAAKNELEGSAYWDTPAIEALYKIWVARYTSPPYPQKTDPDYSGKYDMWQYTNAGSVNGITGNVDMVVSYFLREKAAAKNTNARPQDASAPTADAKLYSAANDEVTAKEEVNLRDGASTKSNIVASIKNGEFVKRTGTGTNGWSKLEYKGQTVYAITSYLTTDRGYTPAGQTSSETDSFTAVNEQVTAKSETNLHSVLGSKDSTTVVHTLKNGEFVRRTGIDNASGWSRLEYNGQTVYAVSSYLTTDSAYTQPGQTAPGTDSFTAVNEQVTAKSETNLRAAPSSKEASAIIYTLKNGEFVKRTGIDNASGWSRLEYNGQIVYAITSYLTVQGE